MIKARQFTKMPFSHDELSGMFTYHAPSGSLSWTGAPMNGKVHSRRQQGNRAGFEYNGDYLVQYRNHRCSARDLAGFLQTGQWARYEPLDGDLTNLKWANLVQKPVDELALVGKVKKARTRVSARAKNKRNTSGYSNVYYHQNSDTWYGRIVHNQQVYQTSYFKTAAEAAKALEEVKERVVDKVAELAKNIETIATILDDNPDLSSQKLAELILATVY